MTSDTYGRPIAFFSSSIELASRHRVQILVDRVRSLPDSDFEGVELEQLYSDIARPFQFSELPFFACDAPVIESPEYTHQSGAVDITVLFPYSGDASLFELSNRISPSPSPVFDVRGSVLTKTYRIPKQQVHKLDEMIDADIEMVRKYQKPVEEVRATYNNRIHEAAKCACGERLRDISENKRSAERLTKSKYAIRKRSDDSEKIILPVQRKQMQIAKTSPKPAVKASPSIEHAIEIKEYDEILSTMSSMVKVMERTPEVFAGMNEEPLRTVLLVALNGIYEGQATGETFNGHGKTDILIRRDDKNVFIAECLMWKGPAYLLEKMDGQLFKYAMWRDSKVALIVFNRGGGFTHTIKTMKETIKNHEQYVKEISWPHESGARYLFRRDDDSERTFVLTAIAFDVPAN